MWQRARIHFKNIESTNSWAKEQLSDFDKQTLTLVTADQQSSGRGRFTRTWLSPIGNFYGTFVFFVSPKGLAIGNIPQVLALSVVAVLEELGFSARIKWPNDIQVSGKKLAGILCETSVETDLLGVVLGIGVNLNMSLGDIETIGQPATSLLLEADRTWDVSDFSDLLYERFASDLELFMQRGFSPFLASYRHYATPLDRKTELTVRNGKSLVKGRFHSFNEDGSLVVTRKDGERLTFCAGEIETS